ncbi:MAG: NAD-dependent epimerase/dehydratase family protein [Deinococcales bacterium]
MKRVLVTGATGMVGSSLVRRLLDQNMFIVVLVQDWDTQSQLIRSGDIHKLQVVSGALEDIAVLRRAVGKFEVDSVFHLGAQTIVSTALKNPLETFEANVRGTYQLLEVCREFAVKRVIVASSDKAYGESAVLPYTEDMPLRGLHPYDASKSCADIIAQTYAHTYQLPVTIARCGNIYGAGDLNWSRIIPGTIRSILEGQPIRLRSDGTMRRDYLFLEDVVDAFLALARVSDQEDVRGEGFNFSPEQPYTVLEVVNTLLKLMDAEHVKPVIENTAQFEIPHQYLDSSKAMRVLGWKARHDLESGLRKTIAWYKEVL